MGIMESQRTSIKTETVLEVFADDERRQVVEYLVDHPENTVSLDFLADQVTSEPSASTSSAYQTNGLALLKHKHLPRLEEVGLIDYDWKSETVRYHPNYQVERLLEFIRSELE